MIDMDQMIFSEASIIIIWTYQDMMEWFDISTANPTQHDQHEPDDPSRSINYHHLDISGHDGMDEQDIGWRNGWC
jgi:hypothetical protein